MRRHVQVKSPAKVNIFLRILGRRPDGYHDLETVMVPLELHDDLIISEKVVVRNESRIDILCDQPSVPLDSNNLCWKAADLLLERIPSDRGVSISLKKQIPAGAGLGGGSSNAASVLLAMNELFQLGLTRPELASKGAKIGADVPFFCMGEPTYATGIGDVIEKIDLKSDVWLILINPSFEVSTPWAYKQWDLQLTPIPSRVSNRPTFYGVGGICSLMENDLERVVSAHFPEIGEMKSALVSAGSRKAMMSGSGSTVFGLFDSKHSRDEAMRMISVKDHWKLYSTRVSCV